MSGEKQDGDAQAEAEKRVILVALSDHERNHQKKDLAACSFPVCKALNDLTNVLEFKKLLEEDHG